MPSKDMPLEQLREYSDSTPRPVDSTQISLYGEGQGGALAIVGAAMFQKVKACVAHYPTLRDYKNVFEKLSYVDVVNFASMVKAKVLMSTGLQDKVSPPSAQYAIYHNLTCEKYHKVYPKHGHELNNFFENEYLKFLVNYE